MSYRVGRPAQPENGRRRRSRNYCVFFRDHLGREQTFLTRRNVEEAHLEAGYIMELVNSRRTGEPIPGATRQWLDALPEKQVAILAAMGLL